MYVMHHFSSYAFVLRHYFAVGTNDSGRPEQDDSVVTADLHRSRAYSAFRTEDVAVICEL
jgi:hypothetical protein